MSSHIKISPDCPAPAPVSSSSEQQDQPESISSVVGPQPVSSLLQPTPMQPIGIPPPLPEIAIDSREPEPVLFRNSDTGFKSPSGLLVSILQNALKQAGHYQGEVDGWYGTATELAVKAFQQERDVEVTGALTETDWTELTGEPVPSVFDRILQVTASFEGTGFEKAVGNFDGAYLTWGIIGYTLKHDLPVFINKIDIQHPGLLTRAFRHKEQQLRRLLAASDSAKEQWANSISIAPRKYQVRSDWEKVFAHFGRFPEVQRMQILDVRERIWEKIALRDAQRWGAADAMDMAVWFDTAVQNGGGGRDSIRIPLDRYKWEEPNATGEARRLRWARIIADGSKPPYIQDVYSRRETMAKGSGKVHGERYRLEDWGLTPFLVKLEMLHDTHATFMPPSLHDENIVSTPPPSIETAPRINDGELRPQASDALAYALTHELDVSDLSPEMRSDINKGLDGTGNNLMISILGMPKGRITTACSSSGLNKKFRQHLVWGANVGPFKVSGLRLAVEQLKKVMEDLRREEPKLYDALGHVGMLCVRRVRGGRSISNHSWGTAIDLTINGKLDARGDNEVQYGLTRIYPIFNRHGFFWGIDFRTEDAMHFEISRQKMEEWHAAGMFGNGGSLPLIVSMLDIGDRGPAVRKLQKNLNIILETDTEVDGHFGAVTRSLVIDFQSQNGLNVDGIAGPKTLRKLADMIISKDLAVS